MMTKEGHPPTTGGLSRYNSDVLEERDAQRWVLKALRETSGSLLAEFRGLARGQLSWRSAADEWCLRDTAGHLRDAEELALAQMTAIESGAPGPLPIWDVDVLPLERDYRVANLSLLLAEFRRLRRETISLLWGLMDEEWMRAAEHPYRGPLTLRQIARELAQHDLEHLWQVRQLKERMAEAARGEGEEG
jgi:hypothetical protein